MNKASQFSLIYIDDGAIRNVVKHDSKWVRNTINNVINLDDADLGNNGLWILEFLISLFTLKADPRTIKKCKQMTISFYGSNACASDVHAFLCV